MFSVFSFILRLSTSAGSFISYGLRGDSVLFYTMPSLTYLILLRFFLANDTMNKVGSCARWVCPAVPHLVGGGVGADGELAAALAGVVDTADHLLPVYQDPDLLPGRHAFPPFGFPQSFGYKR